MSKGIANTGKSIVGWFWL
nr:hypothetical protein [Polaribacter batillariae]